MAPTYQSKPLPTCYATCSIGHLDSHDLPSKLSAIAKAGFQGIELSMPDILSYGKLLHDSEPDPKDYETLVSIGHRIRELVAQHNLTIVMLQPFANFEGWVKGRHDEQRADARERARGWMRIMQAVGTDMLQVGSSDAPGISTDFNDSAADLAELADMMSEKGMRVCYENWCWSTHAPDWKDVWEIVRLADRSNLGLCLDTFQSAGGEWGDPRTETGLVGDKARGEVDKTWKSSLEELVTTVPAEKIFILQISDAYKLDKPLVGNDESGLRPRGQWSHDHRPLPYDGGYLPTVDFLKACLDTGFRGWLSIEVFDSKAGQKHGDNLDIFSARAMECLDKMCHECEGR